MKIKSIILFTSLFILCGCTSKMACSVEKGEYSSSANITFSGKDVKDITVTNTYATEQQAKSACSLFKTTTKDLECNDKTVVIKNYQSTLDESILSKDKIKEYFENNKYTCKSE